MALRRLAIAGLGMACTAVVETSPTTMYADAAEVGGMHKDVSALVQISARPAQLSAPSPMALRLQALTGRLFNAEDLEGVPISDEPWQNLERHGKILGLMRNATESLVGPIEKFYQRAEQRKAVLKKKVTWTSSGSIPKSELLATLRPVNDDWLAFANATVKAFNVSNLEALQQQKDSLDSLAKIAWEVNIFSEDVAWFAEAGIKRVPVWGSVGADMIPAQLEVMRTIVSEFSEKKDKLVLSIQHRFDEIASHLSNSITDPFNLIGNGTCMDAAEHPYSSFEALGCETPLYCVRGCRLFEPTQCRGFDFTVDQKGCGRCMLRMETGFKEGKMPWMPAWTAGQGSGPITSAMVPPNSTNLRCFGRQIPEWTTWPENIKNALQEDIVHMQEGFGKAARLWNNILFKLDRAFWLVESGFDMAEPTFTDSYQ